MERRLLPNTYEIGIAASNSNNIDPSDSHMPNDASYQNS